MQQWRHFLNISIYNFVSYFYVYKKLMSHINLTNLTGYSTSIAGGDGGSISTTTGTYTYTPTYNKKLRDTKIVETSEGMLIEVIYEMVPNQHMSYGYLQNPNQNKTKMRKEIYGSLEGKLQLIKTIEGYENPGYYVDPEIEWEE